MKKADARKIHAYQEAASGLSLVFAAAAILLTACLVDRVRVDPVALIGLAGFCVVFFAAMGAVATDMKSKRIPNLLNLLILAGTCLWWLAAAMGLPEAGPGRHGYVLDVMSVIYGTEMSGAVVPDIALDYPARIGLDVAMGVMVFLPLFASFRFGLGFGGGDVKMMAPLALFFGWPLGMDFFVMTFLVGGVISLGVILGRVSSRILLRFGIGGARIVRLSKLREFPFAPAIALAAIASFAAKLEGAF